MRLKRGIEDLKRSKEIFQVLLSSGLGTYLKKINDRENLFSYKTKHVAGKENLAQKLRVSFEKLGGAFIKLGQMLSLRQDLLPKEYCDEFSKLQDSVPPFSHSEAIKIIESELRTPVSLVFNDFSKEPIAAASIGQVHSAVLKDGSKVAVKVQRPGIRAKIEEDIDIMYFFANLLEKHFSNLPITPLAIVKEFEEYTLKELDYLHEGKTIDIFYKNSQGTSVKIPKMHWEHSTSKLLVMEFIDGQKLSSAKLKKPQARIVAEKFMDSIYNQVFVTGYFHADPHPGNIILIKENNIAFIDFGITGYLDSETRGRLIDLLVAIVEKDTEEATRIIIRLGVASGKVDKSRLSSDIGLLLARYYDVPLKELKLSEVVRGMLTVTQDNNLKLPKNLILLSKCVVTTESVLGMLDPEFNPVQKAKPFIESIIKKKYSPLSVLSDAKKNFLKFRNFIFKFPEIGEGMMDAIDRGEKSINILHKDMNVLIVEMDRSSNRVSLALIITALLIGSALMTNIRGASILGISIFSFVGFSFACFLMFILLISVVREVKR